MVGHSAIAGAAHDGSANRDRSRTAMDALRLTQWNRHIRCTQFVKLVILNLKWRRFLVRYVAWFRSNGVSRGPIAGLQRAFLDVRGREVRPIGFKKTREA